MPSSYTPTPLFVIMHDPLSPDSTKLLQMKEDQQSMAMWPRSMHYKRACRVTLAGILLLTSACGWQLRGLETTADNNHDGEKQTNTQAANVRPLKSGDDSVSTAAVSNKSTSVKDKSEIRLVMLERNHGLASALQRVAWENKQNFSDNGRSWLIIEKEKLEKRPLTVTETGIAAQYQLILTITFSQKNSNGDIVLEPQQIVSWRSYDFDAKLIVAKAQEEEALIVEMREELSRRMLSLIK